MPPRRLNIENKEIGHPLGKKECHRCLIISQSHSQLLLRINYRPSSSWHNEAYSLDLGSSGVQRPPPPDEEEHHGATHGSQEPQEHVDQIHPDGILHPLYAAIALRVLSNVEL